MALWFAGGAVVLVWGILRDPALDYRVLVAGALAPEVVGIASLHAHTLLVSALLLVTVVLATRGRRDARRTWLALPLGTFAHLVLDGVWGNAELFWWPAFGWSLAGERLPSLARGGAVIVAQELAGLAALVWFSRRLAAVRECPESC